MKAKKIQLGDSVTFLVRALDGPDAGKVALQWAGCVYGFRSEDGIEKMCSKDAAGVALRECIRERLKVPAEEWEPAEFFDIGNGLGWLEFEPPDTDS